MKIVVHFSLAILLAAHACGNGDNVGQKGKPTQENVKESLINANIAGLKAEAKVIERYVQRVKWPVEKTGTGLQYWIYEKAGEKGESPSEEALVKVTYSMELLDGTFVEDYQENDVFELQMGRGQSTNGLEEALQKMKIGEKAKVIVPSHLAYGLTGDGSRIPPKAVLVYDVKLINILQQKPKSK